MRTLNDAYNARRSDGENNFLLLRLVAASLVVYGHSIILAKNSAARSDLVTSVFGYRYSGDVGLHIFFVISGFLVTASFCNKKSLFSFVKARLLRIYPALIVCCIFMLLLGAVVTTIEQNQYWSSPKTWTFFYRNATMRGLEFHLPGVFEGLAYKGAVNGSIWSLIVELRLYLIVTLLGIFGVLRKRVFFNVTATVLLFVAIYSPQHLPFVEPLPVHLRVAGMFLAGAILYLNRDVVPLDWRLLVALMAGAIASNETSAFLWVADLALIYGVFLIAFSEKIKLPSYVQDYSYGIYLYAWPIQQLIALVFPSWGPYQMFFVALVFAWLAGAASWFLVERPALRLRHYSPNWRLSAPKPLR